MDVKDSGKSLSMVCKFKRDYPIELDGMLHIGLENGIEKI